MSFLRNGSYYDTVIGTVLGVISVILFFGAVVVVAFLVRQKRNRELRLAVPMLVSTYICEQCFDLYLSGAAYSETAAKIREMLLSVPTVVPLLYCIAMAVLEAMLLNNIHRHKYERITGMSIKEAMDGFPDGVLCYAPKGRVMLVNQAMKEFCRQMTGDELVNGDLFTQQMMSGQIRPGGRIVTVGDENVFVLPDETVWKINLQDIPFEDSEVRMLTASEITEEYRKTEELRAMQKGLAALGERLAKVNREIVDLTAEREMLNAKIRIHDEMGKNLLIVKHFILNGGTESEKAAMIGSLYQNVSFLMKDLPAAARDECELMIDTASRLGVTVFVTGTIPDCEPQRHILATAIHECFTNTLRHAHGNELYMNIEDDEDRLRVVLTNNGNKPAGEIEERGGLALLRNLTEREGGRMTILNDPSYAVVLELPKEEYYGI